MKKCQLLILVLAFSAIFMLGMVDAKKKRPVEDRRPLDIEPELYCNSCQAIVREVLKKIGASRKEYDVADALTNLCIQRNFVEYEYPPPDMLKGCHAFISGWDEVLENMLIKRSNNADIESQICFKRTRACLGVDPSAKAKQQGKGTGVNSGFVTINDKQVPVGADGSININGGDL